MQVYSRIKKRVTFTHECCALVVLDVALIDRLCQLDVLAEALLLEVPDGKLVGKGEEVKDTVSYVVVFQVVHQMCSVAFHLLVGRYRAEHNLSEP